jgi:hypothetical protein
MGPPASVTPQVFLSSTRRDMDRPADPPRDVRVRAHDAIQSAGGTPVGMENTPTPHVSSWAYCEAMLRESTHYLGVFAYRRGWCPPELGGRSVTEAEFDWALDARRQGGPILDLAVFVPDENHGDAWKEFLDRSEGQTPAEFDDQCRFLDRVRTGGKAVNQFRSIDALRDRIFETVYRWRHGGVRARHAAPSASAAESWPFLALLGRAAHLTEFVSAVKRIDRAGDAAAGCFVVHGPYGFGHEYLIERCVGEFARAAPLVRRVTLSAGAVWREPTAAGLARAVGEQLHLAARPETVGDLARALAPLLDRADLVLEVHAVVELDGGLAAFAREFWDGLVAGLAALRPRRRLIGFARVDGPVGSFAASCQRPGDAAFDPRRPVLLPELDRFSRDDLIDWLSPWLRHRTEAEAARVMERTAGEPAGVYGWAADRRPWDQ